MPVIRGCTRARPSPGQPAPAQAPSLGGKSPPPGLVRLPMLMKSREMTAVQVARMTFATLPKTQECRCGARRVVWP